MSSGFCDLQVNGYVGVDFNADDLSADSLHLACRKLAADGVHVFLPTIVTDTVTRMTARLRRLADLRAQDPLPRGMIIGFHVEGPFLNGTPGYRGAHPARAIRAADTAIMQRLLDAGQGLVRLVTLAPERDAGLKVTRFLVRHRIVVSAGHSDATRNQLRAAIDAGLTLFTHLGNGCPLEMPRHDNIIQRVLSLRGQLWITFIADGVHIPFFALGNYLRTAGLERAVIVTDAMAAAGCGPGQYRLGRWKVRVDKNLAAWAPDRTHLVGSAVTMPRGYANLVAHAGLTPRQAAQITHLNPRRALGLNPVGVNTPS